MSKRLEIPVSTLFETLKQVEKIFDFTIVLKDSDKNVTLSGTIPVESAYQVLVDMEDENAAAPKTPDRIRSEHRDSILFKRSAGT